MLGLENGQGYHKRKEGDKSNLTSLSLPWLLPCAIIKYLIDWTINISQKWFICSRESFGTQRIGLINSLWWQQESAKKELHLALLESVTSVGTWAGCSSAEPRAKWQMRPLGVSIPEGTLAFGYSSLMRLRFLLENLGSSFETPSRDCVLSLKGKCKGSSCLSLNVLQGFSHWVYLFSLP